MSLTTPTLFPSHLTSFLAHIRTVLIRLLLRTIRLFSPSLDALLKRLLASPGLPVPNPSVAYWQVPEAGVGRRGADVKHGGGGTKKGKEKEGGEGEWMDYADVVVIGSGITGTSFVRTLLDWERDNGRKGLRVVMVEARGACSGATGRNGGHITPILYDQYPSLLSSYGPHAAKQIINFRLAHLPALLSVASEEGLLGTSQCRSVESLDVFHERGLWEEAKERLRVYERDMGKGHRVVEGEEVGKLGLGLKGETVGCLEMRGGAVHPYRLVTGILERLLKEYSSTFHLYTHTPCTAISMGDEPGHDFDSLYTVTTPHGTIRTSHVIHATNGWAAHLLPGMRGKIIPARGVMTAQTVDVEATKDWAGKKSFVFFPESGTHAYDYLTQMPVGGEQGRYPAGEGEMMLGGGFRGSSIMTELGNADDAGWNEETGAYLGGALGRYFVQEVLGRKKGVRKLWSGVLGISADWQPWVGRIPEVVAGRRAPRARETGEKTCEEVDASVRGLAGPGEWISAGYSGEGMVHAWLSGKALAYMVLGEKVDGWLPSVYGVSSERVACAGIEELVAGFLMP